MYQILSLSVKKKKQIICSSSLREFLPGILGSSGCLNVFILALGIPQTLHIVNLAIIPFQFEVWLGKVNHNICSLFCNDGL